MSWSEAVGTMARVDGGVSKSDGLQPCDASSPFSLGLALLRSEESGTRRMSRYPAGKDCGARVGSARIIGC